MSTEALDRIKLRFALLDSDANGYLEADDFELTARRIVQAVPDSDDAAKNAVFHAHRKYWMTLLGELDSDHDGRVSFEEYAACVRAPERFDDAVSDYAESLAALIAGADGLIGRPDFVALMTAAGFEPENIDRLFDALQPNDSDRISASDWVTGIKDFYGSDRTDILGHHLLGDPKA